MSVFYFFVFVFVSFFFFKQKTAYEMRISDWSSDVCSSDLGADGDAHRQRPLAYRAGRSQMSAMKSFAKTAGAGMLVLALMGSQANGQALRGHNTNAPVDVAADRIEVQDRADRAIFSGDVIARQGDMTLSAARLTVEI